MTRRPRREYVERDYRDRMDAADLTAFSVKVQQTDLRILAERDLTEQALRSARIARRTVEAWIESDPRFGRSLVPVECSADAPRIIREMCAAGKAAGVGPMAAVAGAIAECVARELARYSPNVIVENGGDVYVMGDRQRTALIFAGASPLSNRVGLVIPADRQPLAICTSSGTVGPSLSFGKADAAIIAAGNGALADAVATAVGNRVQTAGDLETAIEAGAAVPGVIHVVAIVGERMAAWGQLSLVRIGPRAEQPA